MFTSVFSRNCRTASLLAESACSGWLARLEALGEELGVEVEGLRPGGLGEPAERLRDAGLRDRAVEEQVNRLW